MTTMTKLRAAVLALFLVLGAATGTQAIAQEEEATQAVGQVTDTAEDVVEEDDEGFDWGLLGLLGLAGLAGLMRRPQPVVHDDLRNSATTTRVDRDNDRTTI